MPLDRKQETKPAVSMHNIHRATAQNILNQKNLQQLSSDVPYKKVMKSVDDSKDKQS